MSQLEELAPDPLVAHRQSGVGLGDRGHARGSVLEPPGHVRERDHAEVCRSVRHLRRCTNAALNRFPRGFGNPSRRFRTDPDDVANALGGLPYGLDLLARLPRHSLGLLALFACRPGRFGFGALGRFGFGALGRFGFGALGRFGFGALGRFGFGVLGRFGFGALGRFGFGTFGRFGFGALGRFGFGALGRFGFGLGALDLLDDGLGLLVIQRL